MDAIEVGAIDVDAIGTRGEHPLDDRGAAMPFSPSEHERRRRKAAERDARRDARSERWAVAS
ncbi:hypothetical protein [Dermatobacter hominis]|uniref:hypothetical protein n=1 Tax=Dermatobacter hominis TaxID=2884263 RepID=UPI001D100879|nr:hypothetical protein [Dermatobacter hominis]UDY37459.1 hypothetical protein LH044_07925 [Dermatobacter hominis]